MKPSIVPTTTQAILIGASEFEDENLLSIDAAERNVNKLKELFTHPEVIGIPDDNIIPIINALSGDDISHQLDDIVSKKVLNTLIIYYAGHGIVSEDQKLYLATKKTNSSKPELGYALPFSKIGEIVTHRDNQAKKIIIILDCCYSGKAMREFNYKGRKKVCIITATHCNEKADAPPGSTYMAFTGQLVSLLDKGIDNGKNTLTLEEIYSELKKQLMSQGFPEPQIVSYKEADKLEIAFNRAYRARARVIFLAKVTDDLEEQHKQVKGYLEQQGIRLLPSKTYSFSNLQESLDQDLAQCCLFVQLLNDKVGNGFPQFQYERANIAGLPILQWRDPELDLQSVRDPTHHNLLQARTVTVMELTKFQSCIIEQLQPKSEEKPKTVVADMWVFINHGPEDMEFALQIQEFLVQKGIGYSLPLTMSATTKAAVIREDLEENLLNCDAVIVPYYNTHVARVRKHLIFCLSMRRKREQPLKIIAVCDKPLPDKPPLCMKLPYMEILECPTLQVETCLPRFIEAIKT
jgi:hypothetical protein